MTAALRSFGAEEAGEIIGKSAWWMKDKARSGEIPYTRPGKTYRWTAEQLAEILRMYEKRPVSSGSTPPRKSTQGAEDDGVPLLESKPPRQKRRAA